MHTYETRPFPYPYPPASFLTSATSLFIAILPSSLPACLRFRPQNPTLLPRFLQTVLVPPTRFMTTVHRLCLLYCCSLGSNSRARELRIAV